MSLAFLLLFWLANAASGDTGTESSLVLINEPYADPLNVSPESRSIPFHPNAPTLMPNVLQIIRKPKRLNIAQFGSIRSDSDPSSVSTDVNSSAESPKTTVLSVMTDNNRNEQPSQKLNTPVVLIPMPLEDAVRTVNHPHKIVKKLNRLPRKLVVPSRLIGNPYYQQLLDYAQSWSRRNEQDVEEDSLDMTNVAPTPSVNVRFDDTRRKIDALNEATLSYLGDTYFKSWQNVTNILARLNKETQKNTLLDRSVNQTKNDAENSLTGSNDVSKWGRRKSELTASSLENDDQLNEVRPSSQRNPLKSDLVHDTDTDTTVTFDDNSKGQTISNTEVNNRIGKRLLDATKKASVLNSEPVENAPQSNLNRRSGSGVDFYNHQRLNNAVKKLARMINKNKSRRSDESSETVPENDFQRLTDIFNEVNSVNDNKRIGLNSELAESDTQSTLNRRFNDAVNSEKQFNEKLNNAVKNLVRIINQNKFGRRSEDFIIKVTEDDIEHLTDAANEVNNAKNTEKLGFITEPAENALQSYSNQRSSSPPKLYKQNNQQFNTVLKKLIRILNKNKVNLRSDDSSVTITEDDLQRLADAVNEGDSQNDSKTLGLTSESVENTAQSNSNRRSSSPVSSYNQYNQLLNNAVKKLISIVNSNQVGRRSGGSSIKVTEDDIQRLTVNKAARVDDARRDGWRSSFVEDNQPTLDNMVDILDLQDNTNLDSANRLGSTRNQKSIQTPNNEKEIKSILQQQEKNTLLEYPSIQEVDIAEVAA